jgi:predicted Zn-ribbon and HTH transcriptional regulator
MTQLKYDQSLVRGLSESARYDVTHRGQADWAIGPKSCKECRFFIASKQTRAPGRCQKYTQVMQGREGPRFPPTALCCRFFELLSL